MLVTVKAVPRSRRTAAVGVQDGAVRLRRGSTGARKLIEIDGDASAIAERLAALDRALP